MIELAKFIGGLRSELQAARVSGAPEELRFEVGPVEIELSLAVEKQDGISGKVRFWVFDLSGDDKASHLSTQRVKLTLQPVLPGAPITQLGPEGGPLITGLTSPREE